MELFNTTRTYDLADFGSSVLNQTALVDYHLKPPADYDMQSFNQSNKKRDANYMHAQELQWKLKSKQDFIVYLD